MDELHLDFETRGRLDLRKVGLHRYARHPQTDVWCLGYAFDEEEPEIIGSMAIADPSLGDGRVANFIDGGGPVFAHNAPFELAVWNEIMAKRYGWPALRPEQVHCTMAMCYAMGLPGALEDAAMALGIDLRKDAEGRAIMLKLAKPRKMDGEHPVWWNDEAMLFRLYDYCQQDVRVEREIHRRARNLSPAERQIWLMDYAINNRGIGVDLITARAAITMAEKMKDRAAEDLTRLTNSAVQSVTAIEAMKEWVESRLEIAVPSMAKDMVVALLKRPGLPDDVRQVLTIRQETGKASVAKLTPMIDTASTDDRVYNTTQYHGAATGRWAGRKIQPHNMTRDVPKADVVERVFGYVRQGDIDSIDMIYGPPMTMLSRCMRGFFVPAKGKVFNVGDFANVEGRGGAWFCGEDWKIKAFREADAGTGPDLYLLAYSKAFGVPIEEAYRPHGKVIDLAFQYQGGLGAWRKFDQTLASEKVLIAKTGWRGTHAKTVKTWYRLQDAAIGAVRQPGEVFTAGAPGREVAFRVNGSFLWCRLPSGRLLCYPYPKILPGMYGDQLTYMAPPGQDTTSIVEDPINTSKWARVSTYGGSLLENIIQAICRDLLAHCMLAMKDYVVMHVHDEIIIESPEKEAEKHRAAMEKVMRSVPAWAAGFPLHAECKTMRRYGK